MKDRTCWLRYKQQWEIKLQLKLCKKGAELAEFEIFKRVLKLSKNGAEMLLKLCNRNATVVLQRRWDCKCWTYVWKVMNQMLILCKKCAEMCYIKQRLAEMLSGSIWKTRHFEQKIDKSKIWDSLGPTLSKKCANVWTLEQNLHNK